MSLVDVPAGSLADAVRALYRASYKLALASQTHHPLILPYSLLGPFIVPTLFLAIPHSAVRHPWRWRARWLVVAWVIWLDANIIRTTKSGNMAVGYANGLMAFWGVISTMNVLIWRNAQRDAARVVRVQPRPPTRQAEKQPVENGIRQRKGHERSDQIDYEKPVQYVWQPFPEEGTFGERLNWALDMTTNFRFAGWNWSISAIPRPKIPSHGSIEPNTPADLSSLPVVTPTGYRRRLTESSFVRSRLLTAGIMYLILDFLAVHMTKDPYFILGPDHPAASILPLPLYLDGLPVWGLRIYRQIFSLAGIISAISGAFNLNDLMQYYIMGHLFPARGELWQYPSTFGSFSQVLERGLAGWWGGWWHQTFRSQFSAPARFLVREGYLRHGSLAAVVVAFVVSFAQSGLLHAMGSISSIPGDTKVWRAPAFFSLQIVGVLVQYAVEIGLQRRTGIRVPRQAAQGTRLLFTMAWLHWTSDFLCHDLAGSGIWLLEPVPFSFFRMLGFGRESDRWWRWDEWHRPGWYTGRHWWQSGISL
ncbi:uncharacterized protein J7T54_006013 [Emericellopsis cladophorae]|uniref:Wax synthase domain-containing protein n=1 Tax=Emericellopsis cladophorae TaxID=2686198 RepID=A0A9P9Y8S9_9HYPO|nr:uncharacterized protein J7T54_006013 [Emericellopsis cladophorae]KAI6785679.1 hypothetical protein J7T54_006013 [Emericellopsis cladophorae]